VNAHRLIGALVVLAAVALACGAPAAAPTPVVSTATATVVATAVPSATLAPARPTPTLLATQPPQATPTPATLHLGNDSGTPIYLYNSPTIGDRIQTYPPGTAVQVIGEDVEGDGLTWHIVRAPDGTEGYLQDNDTLPQD
jgi:hypothetical protein